MGLSLYVSGHTLNHTEWIQSFVIFYFVPSTDISWNLQGAAFYT